MPRAGSSSKTLPASHTPVLLILLLSCIQESAGAGLLDVGLKQHRDDAGHGGTGQQGTGLCGGSATVLLFALEMCGIPER